MIGFEKYKTIAVIAAIEAGKAILNIYGEKEFGTELKDDQSPLTIADRQAHEVIKEHLSKTGLPVLSEEGKMIPYNERKRWNYFWMVDPLDGTKEFIKRNGEFTVNIALIQDQSPVIGIIYIPVEDVLYVGEVKEGARKISKASKQDYDITPGSWPGEELPNTKPSIYGVVASRSHMSHETEAFINQIRQSEKNIRIISKGSSLKICMVAEGEADIYPRFGLTSEWDTAAGHAIAEASGASVLAHYEKTNINESSSATKNRFINLTNPYVIINLIC